jgi:hypothetical protein
MKTALDVVHDVDLDVANDVDVSNDVVVAKDVDVANDADVVNFVDYDDVFACFFRQTTR